MIRFFDSVIDLVQRWVDALNQVQTTRGLFTLILPFIVVMMWPWKMIDNEVNYLMLAHLRVDAAAFHQYSAIFDASNARFLGEYIIGTLVLVLGYDGAHIVTRLATAVFYSFGFAFMFRGLSMSGLTALAVLSFTVVLTPLVIGGEWLFNGAETKTFAYGFVLVGLGMVFRSRLLSSIVMFVAATYFHFLVGGFWAFASLTLVAFRERKLKPVMVGLLTYLALISPLIFLLAAEQLSAVSLPVPEHGLTADQIYTNRSAGHNALFAGLDNGAARTGLAMTLVSIATLFTTFFYLARKSREDNALNSWICLLALYLMVAVTLVYFDQETGFWGKFYVFRPALLIFTLGFAALLKTVSGVESNTDRHILTGVLFLVSVPFLVLYTVIPAGAYATLSKAGYASVEEAVTQIHAHSTAGEIVLLDEGTDFSHRPYPEYTFAMKIDRPTLVNRKFAPSSTADLYHWYDLLQFRDRVFEGHCPKPSDPPVKLIVYYTDKLDQAKTCGVIVWSSARYSIYRLGGQSTH